MKKLLYVTNIPTPYKLDYLALLGAETDLTVAFERQSASNRDKSWQAGAGEYSFRVVHLNARPFGEEFSFSAALVRHLRKHRYDRVIFGGYNSPTVILAMEWMRLHRRPYGITCDGILPKEASAKGWREGLKRSLISHGDFFLSSGKVTTGELVRYGADPSRVHTIPFSSVHEADILPAPPDRDAAKAALGCTGQTVLLYVGRFIPCKGLDLLLPAFARLREQGDPAVLYLVGGDEKQLHALGISRIPEGVRCVPFRAKAELAPYYTAADLLILPTRGDSWGLVVNEAMAYGVPVLTTDHCVAGLELVEPGVTGGIVPAGREDALYTGILDCLSIRDPGPVLATARRYTIEAMARAALSWL